MEVLQARELKTYIDIQHSKGILGTPGLQTVTVGHFTLSDLLL